ncbi:MAG: hypothetical protein RLZZ293_1311 [Pseudomonadota bacterium]|jgi:deoxyribodipyrimidine photo-lyase
MQCTINLSLPTELNLIWLRRNLRINDNQAIYLALKHGVSLACYVWDQELLNQQHNLRQQLFIYQSLVELRQNLRNYGSDLLILYGSTASCLIDLCGKFKIKAIYYNQEYDPQQLAKDQLLELELIKHGSNIYRLDDQLIFPTNAIRKADNSAYTVFTAYKRAWLNQFERTKLLTYSLDNLVNNFYQTIPFSETLPTVANITNPFYGGESHAQHRLGAFSTRLDHYHEQRDYPSLNSGSALATDLCFGTISIRQLIQLTLLLPSQGSQMWLSELVWREFFMQILANFPHVVAQPFHLQYNNLTYPNNPLYWQAWCNGQTGVPIVDAGMRQLQQTGLMHNRVRMICASFLCKDLLIDWRYGERYFAQHLLDYELSSNNGNWQWCASTGCDAQPYFRMFNPYLQAQKFDPDAEYIRQYVPELAHLSANQIHSIDKNQLCLENCSYPKAIVNHHQQIKLAKLMFSQK